MPTSNVWIEEVNTALKKEIYETVKVYNSSKQMIPLNPKAITIRKPEEDFKVESFPAVSIYNLSYAHDPQRYNPSPVVIERRDEDLTVTMEDPAVSFNLNYQLDFWTQYQVDMDIMTRTWLSTHFRQFNLPVLDDGGTLRSSNCFITEPPRKADLMKDDKRLFHTIFSYRIWVELDSGNRYNVSMVVTRDISAEEK